MHVRTTPITSAVFPFLAHPVRHCCCFRLGFFYANFCYEIVWRFDFDLILFFASVKINLFTAIEKNTKY